METNYCIGNTWDPALIDSIVLLNAKAAQKGKSGRIREVFGSIPSILPSVRTPDRLPKVDIEAAYTFVKRARSADIEPHWTMNQMLVETTPDFRRSWEDVIKPRVKELYDVGVRQFVIAHPLLLALMRETLPKAYLEVSTVAGLDSTKELAEWKKLGADGVCPHIDLNRDLDGLRSLKKMADKLGMRVKILVSEACLQGCPHRHTTCYLLQSLGSERIQFNGYPFWCNDRRAEDPAEWLKAPFIPPQWIEKYQELTGVEWFKITGRTFPTEKMVSIAEKYMEGVWDGNMMELIPQYTHLAGLAPVTLEIDTGAWARSDPPFLRDARFRCMDHCGRTCTHCDTVMQKMIGGKLREMRWSCVIVNPHVHAEGLGCKQATAIEEGENTNG